MPSSYDTMAFRALKEMAKERGLITHGSKVMHCKNISVLSVLPHVSRFSNCRSVNIQDIFCTIVFTPILLSYVP